MRRGYAQSISTVDNSRLPVSDDDPTTVVQRQLAIAHWQLESAACQIGQFRWDLGSGNSELGVAKLREILWAVKPSAQDERRHLETAGLAKSTKIDKRLGIAGGQQCKREHVRTQTLTGPWRWPTFKLHYNPQHVASYPTPLISRHVAAPTAFNLREISIRGFQSAGRRLGNLLSLQLSSTFSCLEAQNHCKSFSTAVSFVSCQLPIPVVDLIANAAQFETAAERAAN
ncbi:hypothetical protein ACLKA6_006725 [Drosophila palustris]